ncbi:MAG: hypothetical protein JEZ06_07600 [Anaerolineaceae bacterium]|nr:hypothetical protein [Anaerolineaceae bacterium]
MDHVVYVDAKAKELNKLLDTSKKIILRGAAGRKIPYGRVHDGDRLFFINNNAEGMVKASALVISVHNSEKLTKDESEMLLEENKEKLNLSAQQYERWAGKRYLVLIEVSNVKKIEPFPIDKSEFGNMDDWLPVNDINLVRNI